MKKLLLAIFAVVLISLFIFVNIDQKKAYVSITFDDGLASQYGAAKILENYGWQGTFYVPSGLTVFENRSLMTFTQLQDLQAKYHEIGTHSATHIKASTSSLEEYEQNIINGKKILQENNLSAENFAYPYGDFSKLGAIETHFKSGRTVVASINKIPPENVYELKGLPLVHLNNEYKVLENYLADLEKNGGWLIIVLHGVDFDENVERQDVDVTEKEFIWILEQVKKSGADVKTVHDALII